jgi:hypothetical protein
MSLPVPHLRGETWYADLREEGGSRHQSLGIGRGVSHFEVGAALARKIDELRLGAKVSQPDLFSLDDSALTIAALADMYREAMDPTTAGGGSYLGDCLRRVVEGIGHMTVRDLCAPTGNVVLKVWRDKLWAKGWRSNSVRNVLNFAKHLLVWGQTDERNLTGPIPRLPKFKRNNRDLLVQPTASTFTEVDFRYLREHWADEAIRTGGMIRMFGRDPAVWKDYIARRKLYLSLAFYTGAHPEDLGTWRGAYLSVEMGRYERHNTKSSRVIKPECFDMPEQLQLDCEAELRRRGIPRFHPDELPAGGIAYPGTHYQGGGLWCEATRVLRRATARLWPDGSREGFTFRLARRSTVWEYTIRGWRSHEIAALLGHVDEQMVQRIYRRCCELGIVSPTRVAWTVASGPHGGPSRRATVTDLRAVK